MLLIIVVAGAILCAIEAILTKRLLISALWLAGTSALVALTLYLLGAAEVAVVELSVGAGLVTVLFVFAINIAGDEPIANSTIVPKPVAWGLVIVSVVLLGWMTLTNLGIQPAVQETSSFSQVLWHDRRLDVLLQAMFIFAGVLGVIGLIADSKKSHKENDSEERQ
jgi:uncharacterized MnhB-related membrane protein